MQTIAQMFASFIAEGNMTHIKEVAEKAGVSISTVSRALSGKVIVDPQTKKRVLQVVRELNYQPNALAKGLKEGSSKTIGLIIPDIKNLVFPATIRGISEVAKKYGYTVVLCNTDEDLDTERFYIQNLRQRLVDGLIFSTATNASTHIVELKETGYPVVLLFRHLEEIVDAVIIDNLKGSYQATKFLLDRGYRRIALINGTMELDLYQQRFAGYQKALGEWGLSVDPELIIHEIKGWEDGYRAMQEIWRRGSWPDAVFATSDPKAMGIMKAIREKGLNVPKNVAVMGYDGLEMSELMDPPLATMAQPFYDAGVKAAERLIKLISSKRKLRPIIEKLEARLVIRESVKFGKATHN
jgi:DNA-binding LacI/PurR family transcriptional regulator